MANRGILLFLIIAFMIGIAIWCGQNKSKEQLTPTPLQLPLAPPEELHYKPGFLPSHQGPWFQGMPPSLRVENNYHRCIQANGGDYGNYELRQKCYIQTLKDGTYDKADLMCWNHKDNEDEYFKCQTLSMEEVITGWIEVLPVSALVQMVSQVLELHLGNASAPVTDQCTIVEK